VPSFESELCKDQEARGDEESEELAWRGIKVQTNLPRR